MEVKNVLSNKKFEMKSSNSVLSVEPTKINFTFNEINQVCHKTMKLNNISGKALRVYVLPLQSKYFFVDLDDKNYLLPGLPLTTDISFTADELRQYNDWVKIVCSTGEYNLMIPLHAAPACPYNCIPQKINLGSVLLGEMVIANFSIPSCIDTDAEFLIYLPEPSSDFCVEPIAGTVVKNGLSTKVTIKFQPTEYITVHFPIQLYIPHSSMSPFTITVLADCKPGFERLHIPEHEPIKKKSTVTRQQIIHAKSIKQKQKEDDPVEALQKLNTVHGVVKFLLAKDPKKPSPDDMLGPFGRYLSEDYEIYKKKEQEFRKQMQQFKSDNQAALLHQRDKPGASLDIDMEQVLVVRTAEYQEFQNLLKPNTTAHPDALRRAVRSYDDVPDTSFTDEPNDMWFARFQALSRFIQVARRVIIINRFSRRLLTLQNAKEFIELDLQKQEMAKTDETEHKEKKEITEDKIIPEKEVKNKKAKEKKLKGKKH